MLGSDVFVVVPAFNEARVIRSVAEELVELGASVVVVDDGSSDGTGEALRGVPLAVCRHAVNLGQGAALSTGIELALRRGARIVVTFDADGQHRAADVPRLVDALERDRLDAALGSRFLAGGEAPGLRPLRRALLAAAVRFTRLTTGLPVTDAHNGLRAFTREAAARIRPAQNGMSHASEILHRVRALGLRFAEVPVIVAYTSYSRAKGQRVTNALNIVWELIEGRFARK
jgi:polyprenyl-phospho-N-acetylgalactosaminyl synthase